MDFDAIIECFSASCFSVFTDGEYIIRISSETCLSASQVVIRLVCLFRARHLAVKVTSRAGADAKRFKR